LRPRRKTRKHPLRRLRRNLREGGSNIRKSGGSKAGNRALYQRTEQAALRQGSLRRLDRCFASVCICFHDRLAICTEGVDHGWSQRRRCSSLTRRWMSLKGYSVDAAASCRHCEPLRPVPFTDSECPLMRTLEDHFGHMGDCGQPAIIWRSHLNHSTAGLLKKSSSLTPPLPISHIFALG
jgi:hypothetical protein